MNLTEEVLIGIAAVAISLIGFSGVVTALGRRDTGLWSPAEMLQLRTLVEPSIVTLFSAFMALALGFVIAGDELIWRIANGICFAAHAVGMAAFMRRGSTSELHASHRIGFSVSVLVMVAMLAGMFSPPNWAQFTLFLGLSLGIGVSVHNFYLLLFPASESDER